MWNNKIREDAKNHSLEIISKLSLADGVAPSDVEEWLEELFKTHSWTVYWHRVKKANPPAKRRRLFLNVVKASKSLVSAIERLDFTCKAGLSHHLGRDINEEREITGEEEPIYDDGEGAFVRLGLERLDEILKKTKGLSKSVETFIRVEAESYWYGNNESILVGKPGRNQHELIREIVMDVALLYERITKRKFGRKTYKGDRGEILANDVLRALSIEVKESTVRVAIDAAVATRQAARKAKKTRKIKKA